MSTFGVEVGAGALKFISDTNTRLQLKGDIGKNPFYGRAYTLHKEGKQYIGIFRMDPVYPRAYIGGWFIIIPALILSHFSWTPWYIPGVVLLSLGFFWSKYFFYLMLRLGLKKAKYRGSIRLLPTRELLEVLTV